MWIKFNYTNHRDGLRTSQKVVIEVADATKALSVATYLGNADHVKDVKVVIRKPKEDMETIFINENGVMVRNEHLVSDWDLQTFVWAIKAGIRLGKK